MTRPGRTPVHLSFGVMEAARSLLLATTARRVGVTLAVVFSVLAASGWLSRGEGLPPGGFAAQLSQWRQDTVAGVGLVDPAADPAQISRHFGTLGHRQQMLLAERYPLVVGNLDGVPVEVRYQANRHALAAARDRERRRMRDDRLSATGKHEAGRRMHRFESMLRPERQILAFDPSGGGRAAEVFGDLTTAERISVVVPGVDTDLLTFERTQLKYRAPSGMAEALHREQRNAAPRTPTAVIAWADYTAPGKVGVAAATGELAQEGGDRLLATLAGLPQAPTVALFCHSYGSVVCGVAADRLPGRVTDIAVAGSPGMRASHASRLGTTARIWATRSANDWIGDVPHLAVGPIGHGQDPAHPAFGALRVDSSGVRGHDGYFVPGTGSLRDFARIGVGDLALGGAAGERPRCVPADGPVVPS